MPEAGPFTSSRLWGDFAPQGLGHFVYNHTTRNPVPRCRHRYPFRLPACPRPGARPACPPRKQGRGEGGHDLSENSRNVRQPVRIWRAPCPARNG